MACLRSASPARLAIVVLLLVPTSCQEPNPDFGGPAGGSSSAGSGSTSDTVPTTTNPTTVGTVGMEGTSTGPGVVDSSSGGTTDPMTTSSGSSSSGGSGGEEPLYPPCMLDGDPVCPLPYVVCYDFAAPDFTVCTLPCMNDGDCPAALTGDAQPSCAGQGNDQCVLDCAGGATCPDGMECRDVGPAGMFQRCLWPS